MSDRISIKIGLNTRIVPKMLPLPGLSQFNSIIELVEETLTITNVPTFRRVRQILPKINYYEMVRLNLIPDLNLMTPDFPTVKYPMYINTAKNHSVLGRFVEKLLYLKLTNSQINFGEEWRLAHLDEPLTEIHDNLYGWIGMIFMNLMPKLDSFRSKQMYYNQEINAGKLQGHPDFMFLEPDGSLSIYDCKNISKFTSKDNKPKQQEIFLQILAYAAIIRSLGQRCNMIGFILPMQSQIVTYDISSWDLSNFLGFLQLNVDWDIDDVVSERKAFTAPQIGGSISFTELLSTNPSVPIQFLWTDIYSAVPYSPYPRFVHSFLSINISSKSANIEHLKSDYQRSISAGASGYVIHVGKYVSLDYNEALEIMRSNIAKLLTIATESCPLLLETPAGQGTELLTNPYSFMQFVMSFPNLQMCLDSCHVFASGYDPSYYLSLLLPTQRVKLIHFNDSVEPRGSRIDRHYDPGLGYIGYSRMKALAELAIAIPCVTELHG